MIASARDMNKVYLVPGTAQERYNDEVIGSEIISGARITNYVRAVAIPSHPAH